MEAMPEGRETELKDQDVKILTGLSLCTGRSAPKQKTFFIDNSDSSVGMEQALSMWMSRVRFSLGSKFFHPDPLRLNILKVSFIIDSVTRANTLNKIDIIIKDLN